MDAGGVALLVLGLVLAAVLAPLLVVLIKWLFIGLFYLGYGVWQVVMLLRELFAWLAG